MKRKCRVCWHRFQLDKERVYTATEPMAVMQALTAPSKQFDVTDCPKCGCQNALAVRMPAVVNSKEDAPDEN